ncbi:anti-sigma factor antagonist [Streptomyces sp. NPDC013178]|uniref:anti-sigma factor antagonist n=1 Tax=unclassified Streptomyces TaxID=2593676 RepID=UPI0034096B22
MAEPAYEADFDAEDDRVRAETSGAPPARTTPVPEIALRPDGDRVVVVIRGELDLESAEQLTHALRAALAAAVGGVDLDLGDVVFCDCSALDVLLDLRQQGLEQGKTLAIRSAGPAVERLLTLTGTDTLFADPGPAPHRDDDTAAPPYARGDGAGDAERDLRVEVVQLRRAMQTRPVIDLARGILMASFALSAQDAWRVLVDASQRTNTKLHHLARDLVSAVQGAPPAEAVQEQVAAAVARVRSAPSVDAAGADGDRIDRHDR